MKLTKKIFFTLFALYITILPTKTFAAEDVKLWINGDYIRNEATPIIENNRTLVPIRVISENLGYRVNWDNKNQIVTIENDSKEKIQLQINNNIVTVLNSAESNDLFSKKISLDASPKIVSNRTFVPIRAISELFGNKINWDNANRTVIIGDGYTPMIPEVTDKAQNNISTIKNLNLQHIIRN